MHINEKDKKPFNQDLLLHPSSNEFYTEAGYKWTKTNCCILLVGGPINNEPFIKVMLFSVDTRLNSEGYRAIATFKTLKYDTLGIGALDVLPYGSLYNLNVTWRHLRS